MSSPTAVIADDHTLIRHGISQMLASAGLAVVAEAADGLEAIAAVRSHQPSLLTLDIAMPYARGIEVFVEARRWSPSTKIIVFSGMTSSGLLRELAELGVDGLFSKRAELSALSSSLGPILAGEKVVGPGIDDLIHAGAGRETLSNRERQVLSLVVQGLNNREIGARLGVSAKTIDNHRTNLMRKIDVHSVAELLAYAIREGLLETYRET